MTHILIAIILIFLIAIIKQRLFIRNLYKEYKHQRALVYVLRKRLNDRQDNSEPFTISDIKEINEWSSEEINRLN